MEQDKVRLIKISKEALYEFIYEKFVEKQGEYLDVEPTEVSDFFDIDFENGSNQVRAFREKSKQDVGYINAGYMVLSAKVFDYIEGNFSFEQEPMKKLATAGEIMAYRHEGFWQCMDTLREKNKLEELWQHGAPWKLWS